MIEKKSNREENLIIPKSHLIPTFSITLLVNQNFKFEANHITLVFLFLGKIKLFHNIKEDFFPNRQYEITKPSCVRKISLKYKLHNPE